MPNVSVIIPTYNRAQVVSRAIRSVLRQTYQDFEIIIVDDGSCDATEEAVKEFRDARIIYIHSRVNQGVSVARNAGLKVARGSYVAFLDSDDEWLPQKLEKQANILENYPAVGGVFTSVRVYPSQRCIKVRLPRNRRAAYQSLLEDNLVGSASTAMLRKSCFDALGFFDQRITFCEDYDMWLRYAKKYEIRVIQEPLAVIHCAAGDRMTKDLVTWEKGYAILEEKLKNELSPSQARKIKAYHAAHIGYLYYIFGDKAKGRSKALEAIRTYSFSPKVWRYYFATCVPQKALRTIRRLFRNYEPLE